MNQGISLTMLAQQIEASQGQQRDLLVPSPKQEMIVVGESTPVIDINGEGFFEPTDWAHGQIANRLAIPRAYYNRLHREDPALLATNVNRWLGADESTRLLRIEGQELRADLSDRYKRIDHPVVLRESLEAISALDEKAVVLSSGITPQRMALKVLFPEITGEVKPGDPIHPGFMVSNSEVGGGSFSVQGFFFRDFCLNGCVFGQNTLAEGIRRRHTGRRLVADVGHVVYQDDTIEAEAGLLAKQSRDIINAFARRDTFQQMLDVCQRAAQSKPVENPEAAVTELAKVVNLNEKERTSALINLIQDRDYSQWGVANAVTRIANETENYDRATELESIGSQILTMQLKQFDRIAIAA